jgi:FkbM family methyltransferase
VTKLFKGLARILAAEFGYEVVSRRVTDDLDPFVQQQRLLVAVPSPIILDVGAHVGETSETYVKKFPTAKIYALEPFGEAFVKLVENLAKYPQVRPFPIGLADRNGEMVLNVNEFDATNSLLATDPRAEKVWGPKVCSTQRKTAARFMTLDQFITEAQIDRIDVLKLDVQGAEYKVLLGATDALARGVIEIIYIEIILLPTYEMQWQLSQYLSFFDNHNMLLFGLYNLNHIRGHLRQLDALFVRRDLDPVHLQSR